MVNITVDVIIPVHNASQTLKETLESVLAQKTPQTWQITACCHDDGSMDDSGQILQNYAERYPRHVRISHENTSRGAGYARNRAVDLSDGDFLCFCDADDLMEPERVQQQVSYLQQHPQRDSLLVGCQFRRDPPDATWHYAQWANGLGDDRLVLEQFREMTLLQPTWTMTRRRFRQLGGYLEAPVEEEVTVANVAAQRRELDVHGLHLVHESFETRQTLRLAEDLRLYYEHLHQDGRLHIVRKPLVIYRHQPGATQCASTHRKLLLRLRVRAFEKMVLERGGSNSVWKEGFVVWGCGRDGKDFVKALSSHHRIQVKYFADVDPQKIRRGAYVNPSLQLDIPIVHVSSLCRDHDTQNVMLQRLEDQDPESARIRKGQKDAAVPSPSKRAERDSATDLRTLTRNQALIDLPVVICVAMNRSGGALERNVQDIERVEGKTLWHLF